ncbi:ATP-dependent DNA helicase RecG [Flavobacterium capsici]|uniref:ATP-dependent DNA helicase RecG n=1 Tax=Flavobacterium capsici TaxID=3075618 RepID=A0AA96J237_9FLAO|nr:MULTISPECIES: ATP-dependent DNA helicase RecG [unclassified Flavobacterium]WNM18645.1 ATP-dependent DNA helicase RecG [Flavobacterium sp. PMR2A8]WNM22696.1 ATP-dependent DNA helicase RecG [Flavobacterium sp. PMTSA4]
MSNSLLQTPIEYLKGVGPQRGELLRKEIGIHKYEDLVNFFPNRYIDRTRYYKINELNNNVAEVQIIGKIIHIKTVEFGKAKKRLVATFVDDTGEMELVWFQGQKWIRESLKLNIPYVIFGKVTNFNGQYNMAHPEMELFTEHEKSLRSAMQPIYPSTEKLTNKGISNRVVVKIMQQLFIETQARFAETLPNAILEELKLIPKNAALFNIHFPKSPELLAKAQFRLKFEELFFIQLQLITKNLVRKHKIKGHPFTIVGNHFNNFYENHLPFELTNAQKKVLKEIRNDLGSNAQMNRLLQGDVGSGKTIVALMAMLIALDNGFQSCLMAPTEILATQHYNGLTELAKDLNINIKILTGSTKTSERKIIHEELENGSLHILIGTHALLEDKVQFDNLGLAIIDEQHRFGVEQRSKLWKKNDIPPHILVMTATPIPRTLAMSLYGDLDVSVIDELPPGRKPIQTVHRYDSNRLKVWKFIKDEIEKGRQIYIVYPLIQESETMDYKDLMDGYESISRDFPLPKYSISIVHGKMKPADKEAEMKRFSEGKTNIMVATTVIEVGVNVPNASVMIIESAERFGLSQLHQLRGRVGRGAEQSYCILMTSHKLSNDSKIRLETMCKTNDGFEIAEVDLKLRGPGDIMGKQQSGVLNLQIADLVKDKDILILARNKAIDLLKKDPSMSLPEHQTMKTVFLELSKKKNIWNYIS